jgi:hypothetical protein
MFGQVPALIANVIIGCKGLTVTNTLAYYNTKIFTDVKV